MVSYYWFNYFGDAEIRYWFEVLWKGFDKSLFFSINVIIECLSVNGKLEYLIYLIMRTVKDKSVFYIECDYMCI